MSPWPQVPSWGELERQLNHNSSRIDHLLGTTHDDASQGWSGGWSGFAQRVSSGFDNVYGQLGGRRVDCLRQALGQSYPMARDDLIRRFNGIEIEQVVDVLLELTKQVAMVMGGSIAAGGAIGAGIGSLALGAGALPGAAVGAGVGSEVGLLILEVLGLSAISEYFVKGMPACGEALTKGILTAWRAPDAGTSPGMDPTGGAAARQADQVHKAAWALARGQEQMVVLLLSAIVIYLGARGVVGGSASLLERGARLRAGIRDRRFGEWLGRNEQKLIAHPLLSQESKLSLPSPDPKTLREFYAKQDPSYISVEEQISKAKTFDTIGLSREETDKYLSTPEGKVFLTKLQEASPASDAEVIYRRASAQIASGSTFPTVALMDSPLIKIVPEGQGVSDYSPFFTTHEALQAAIDSGKTLADTFGLPLSSESTRYSIYKIAPLQPTEVYISKVAPTQELGGLIHRDGGSLQFLTPNRSEWTRPELIDNVPN